MICNGLSKLFIYHLAFILSTFPESTVANEGSYTTEHPVIQILKDSFERWQTLKQPSNRHPRATRNPNETRLDDSDSVKKISYTNERDLYEDFSSYDSISNNSMDEKKICKRYFTNDVPKKKTRRKSIYYINMDSKDGQNILNAFPEIYRNTKAMKEQKTSNFSSWPNKRSPNIKVLTIDLMPKAEHPLKTAKKYTTQGIDTNSLLKAKMGNGELLVLIQQPKNHKDVNHLLEEISSLGIKKESEEYGANKALKNDPSQQPVESLNAPNVSAAVSEVLKLYMKSEAYYKDLSSRLNDFYTKIVETKAQ